jgi:hypothetical protein
MSAPAARLTSRRDAVVRQTAEPIKPWLRDQLSGVINGCGGLAFALIGGLGLAALCRSIPLGIAHAVAFLPAYMLVYPETWDARLAFVQLRFRHGTPLNLLAFLEDARRRGMLRTDGPMYQFRHSVLRDIPSGTRARSRSGTRDRRPVVGG